MAASLKQLMNSRRLRGIPRRELAERMGCSANWVRWLENASPQAEVVLAWRGRYAAALQEIIEERQAKVG